MKQILLNILESICILLVFAIGSGMIYAGVYVLNDGLGGCKFPGIFAIITGFIFFITIIANIINQHTV